MPGDLIAAAAVGALLGTMSTLVTLTWICGGGRRG